MSSRLEAAREKSRLAQEALKAVRDKHSKKHLEDEQKKDAADPRRAEKAYQQWRDSPEGRNLSHTKTAPRSGLPDFGGRRGRKTRRGRKSRSTRRR